MTSSSPVGYRGEQLLTNTFVSFLNSTEEVTVLQSRPLRVTKLERTTMAEAKKKEAPVDYYAALGVEKTASAQEITVDISTAFTIIYRAVSLECAGC